MIKERLRALRLSLREALQLREQLAELEGRMYTPKAPRYSSMPHGSGGENRTMDDLTIIHIQLQDNYRQRLAAIEAEQLSIEGMLNVLTPEQRMIIRYRYFDLLSWEDVCARVHFGWTHTHKLHAAALIALEAAENKNNPEG